MKKVLIVGSSGGLGRQVIKYFKEDEYSLTNLSSKDLDISNFYEVQSFFEKNGYDIVINLSGKNIDGMIHKLEKDTIDKMIDVNIKGNINLLRFCLPYMRKNNYGRIILISSVLSEVVISGTSLYSGSKSFIDNIVKTTSSENISKNITCNSIQLGYFDGGMCHEIPINISNNIKNNIGLNRWGKISELYSTIEYIINTEYITGQNIRIDGGFKGI